MRKPVWTCALIATVMALSVAALGRGVVQADDSKRTRGDAEEALPQDETVKLTGYVGQATWLPESHTNWYGTEGRLSVSLFSKPSGGSLLQHAYVYSEGAALQPAPLQQYLYSATMLSATYQNLMTAMAQETKVTITLPHANTQQIVHIVFTPHH
jgi:hypothetical protein